MSLRRHYPSVAHRPVTTTFPEAVHGVDVAPRQLPPITKKATPHQYPYLFFNPNVSFPEAVHGVDISPRQLPPISKKSTPQQYPYLFRNPTVSFPESVHGDVTNIVPREVPPTSKKPTPQQYPYLFFYPSNTNFTESVHGVDLTPKNMPPTSKKSTPWYYPYLSRGEYPQVPEIPFVSGFQTNNQMPMFAQGRLVNYMGQLSVIFVAPGAPRVFNLPLLGMG